MKLRVIEYQHGPEKHLMFECPGCECSHSVPVNFDAPDKPDKTKKHWGWNGRYDLPTFTPSILVTSEHMTKEAYEMIERKEPPKGDKYPTVKTCCHTFVTDGRIQFLGDCTHKLAGQTVDLPDWD